jgi:hypothetical protein
MFANRHFCMKILYFLPVLFVYVIVYTVVYTFTTYYVLEPRTPTRLSKKWIKLFLSIAFYIFAAMTTLSHTLAMITHPGKINPSKLKNNRDKNIPLEEDIELFCKKCLKERPERSHHCSTCKQCILKMDHHCPWIANCVGFNNQKSFYLFLFYATFGDLIAFICLLEKIIYDPAFVNMILFPRRKVNIDTKYIILEILYSIKDPLLIIVGMILAAAMTIAIGILFTYQSYLMRYNMTSIESSIYSEKIKNPYFFKSRLLAFKSVLGTKVGLEWFLPVFKPNIYNDAYNYKHSEMDNLNGYSKICNHEKNEKE